MVYTTRSGQMSLLKGLTGQKESAANRGMEFEKQLTVIHALYARKGLARIEKNYVPTQPVSDGKWARVIGKGIVDFTGVTAGGRFVAFDAKDCAGHRIDHSRLPEHQQEYLCQVDALGGAAFVLVRFDRHDVYRVPIIAWKTLCNDDMRPEWAVEGLDWLGKLEGQWI